MTAGKTVPELTSETPPIVGTDELVVYRAPGPLKRATATVFSDYIKAFFSASGGSALVGFLQAGANAIARTAQAKMRDVVSVKDFGADPAASAAANTTAFNAAATVAGLSGAFVPAGTYAISGTVVGTFWSVGGVTITGGTVQYIVPSAISGAANVNGESYRLGIKFGDIDATVLGAYLFDGRSSFPNKLGVNNTKPVDDPSVVARVNDTAYTAGTAEVAAVLAGYDNVNNALAGMIASQHSMLYTGADHASIWGGSLHTIYDDADYSVILGGTNCAIEGRGRYAAIVASDGCKLETGASDAESGFRGLISNSTNCTVSGRNSVILGSSASSINSTYGCIFAGETISLVNGTHMGAGGNAITMGATTISSYSFAWGLTHTIDAGYSSVFGRLHTVASGHEYATCFGERCITPFIGASLRSARHRGNVAGRNQSLDFTCSQETTDTTTTRLSVNGAATYPVQPADSIVSGFALVNAVDTATGACSAFRIDFVSERLGTGTPTLRQNATTASYDGLALPTDPTMNVTSGGIYRVQVVGLAATNIAWDARLVVQQTVWTA
jgi:hypothetical protein